VTKRLSRVESLLFELKRRKVFQVASLYAVAAWGASVGAADLLPAFGAPDWAVRAFVISAVLGFPVVVALAWIFEITPKGVIRDEFPGDPDRNPHDASAITSLDAYGTSDYVLVRWQDARGTHERRFDREFRIGRDADCDIRLDDPLISRHHAGISRRDDLWWVRDLGSRNGTLVDGHGVQSAPLPPRCEVQIAERGPRLSVEIHALPSSTTVASGHFRALDRQTIRR
jgi:hypothetical protein